MFLETKREGEATPNLGTLRVDRILMLADEIEKPTRRLRFKMSKWLEEPNWLQRPFCGTAACIGGHAEIMFCPSVDDDHYEEAAARALGLGLQQARQLFYPPRHGGPAYHEINRTRAARVLRHLAATGEVDWSK